MTPELSDAPVAAPSRPAAVGVVDAEFTFAVKTVGLIPAIFWPFGNVLKLLWTSIGFASVSYTIGAAIAPPDIDATAAAVK